METKGIQLYLAPMAGAGDRAFRETCALFGVDFFCTEMISAKAVHFGDKKTALLADVGEAERPMALQLFGSDPEILAEAAEKFKEINEAHETLSDSQKRSAEKFSKEKRFDFIDLNFGCPVPKIVNNGEGSALMRTPEKCYEITKAVCTASYLPVSVKIRAGWDEKNLNAPYVAELCEKAGAKRVAVHGRTRVDFYRDGTLRPEVIREVKQAVSIPVISNGDVTDGESALRLLEKTGCDGLMIGRGAVGSPWVFDEVRSALLGKEKRAIDKKEIIRYHIDLAFRYKPEVAGREMRMHMAQYMKGFRGAASLRDRASHALTKEDYYDLLSLF